MEITKIHDDESSSIELSKNSKGGYSFCIKVKSFGIDSNNKVSTKLADLKRKVDTFLIQQGGGRWKIKT